MFTMPKYTSSPERLPARTRAATTNGYSQPVNILDVDLYFSTIKPPLSIKYKKLRFL
jgi:hypothetical protein